MKNDNNCIHGEALSDFCIDCANFILRIEDWAGFPLLHDTWSVPALLKASCWNERR